jgi:hypothetical protein
VTISRGANKTAAVGILQFFFLGPLNGIKLAGLIVKPFVISLIRAAYPLPFARLCRDKAHNETISAIPETINSFLKIRAIVVNPAGYILITIVHAVILSLDGDFLCLPDVNTLGTKCVTGNKTENKAGGKQVLIFIIHTGKIPLINIAFRILNTDFNTTEHTLQQFRPLNRINKDRVESEMRKSAWSIMKAINTSLARAVI